MSKKAAEIAEAQEPAKKPSAAKSRKTAAAKSTAKKTTAKATAKKAVSDKEAQPVKKTTKAATDTKAAKKPAARKTAAKAKANVDGSHQTAAEIQARVAKTAAEAEAGVTVMEGIDKLAKAEAAKTADFEGSHQTEAQVEAGVAKTAVEAEAGVKIMEGIDKLAEEKAEKTVDYKGSHQTEAQVEAGVAKTAAEAKDGVKVMEGVDALAAKTAAAKDDFEGSHQTEAEVKAGVAKTAAEAEAGAKVIRAIDAMNETEADLAEPARKVLAAKAAAHTYGQVNLSARSEADSKAAAKGFKKPKRKKAAAKKAKAAAPAKPAAEVVIAGIAPVKGKDYAVVVAEVIEEAAQASRAGLTAKAAAKAAVQNALSAFSKTAAAKYEEAVEADILAGSHQTEAEVKAGVAKTAAEADAGLKVMEGIADLAAENASRAVLASKAAAHTYGQVNLSARSQADAKAASKGFKKTKRKKAAKAKAAPAAAPLSDEKALSALIAPVEGVPYKDVIAKLEADAAQASRASLASRTRTVKGAGKPALVVTEEQRGFYDTLDDQTLIDMMAALGVDRDLDTLMGELTRANAIADVTAELLKEAEEAGKTYIFAADGFDASVIPYLTARLGERIPNKKQDNVRLAAKIDADVDRMLINEGMNDSAIYKDLFDDVRQVLIYAQRNGIESLEEMEKIIPADLHKLVDRFMTVAVTILPGWQYNDVKYYEGFLYSVMAQFADLASWQNRALMDIADLYILHGDYNKGNEDYAYVLRENQLKDQIYYRFANVYVPFDLQRAKGIARDALRVIDGRYDYYPKLIEILEK